MKVAIYCRVSTLGQDEIDYSSIKQQEDSCRNYLSSRKNQKIEVFKVYKDTVSAKDLKRPGIQQLLHDAEKKKFELIVSTKLDRISRSLKDFLDLNEKLKSWGIDLIITTQEIDTTTPGGKALQAMMLVFAQFEREMTAERTREKRIQTLKKGIWTGGFIPLGYNLVDKGLLVDESESIIVNYIFDLYLQHKSGRIVASILNKEGYKTKRWQTPMGNYKGGKRFISHSVLSIIKNHLYIGKFKVEDELYPTKHSAIVDEEKFYSAQKIHQSNIVQPKKFHKGKSPNLLESIMHCGFCSNYMTPSFAKKKKQKYFYYKCTKKNKEGITPSHAPKDLAHKPVDEFTVRTLKLFLKEPELLNAFNERIKVNSTKRITELEAKNEDLIAHLRQTKTRISELVTDIENNRGAPSERVWRDRLDEVELERQSIEDQIKYYSEQIDRLKLEEKISTEDHRDIIKEFVSIWENSSLAKKKDLIRVLVRQVDSYVDNNTNEGEIHITYVADHYLKAEWAEIKKCETGKLESLPVRTSLRSGSPDWIRTSNPSVNSRMLCH